VGAAAERRMKILVDHNMIGQARLLFETLKQEGWVDFLSLEFVYFSALELSTDAPDDELWQQAQSRGMLILTDNRNNEDETSLTAVIERESTASSLPVLTVSSLKRLKEASYRQAVALRLVEIVVYLDNYRGTGRIFIP
jgi:predicted nuclease of predicted toxin-antitoxin system